MNTDIQPPSRKAPGRWLYVLPALLLAAAGWTALAQRAGSTIRPGTAEEAAGLEPATDQRDPKRFRIVAPNVIEDTATGIRRTVDLRPGQDIPERFTENLPVNDNLADDRRYGIGPRPVRVLMAPIGLDAEAIPIGLDANGALAVPRRADITGWWSGGFVPGETGPTVLVGHYDSKVAPGVFSRLAKAKIGQLIFVEQSDGSRYLYKVTEVEKPKKSVFPTDKVYGPTESSTLRLVTCGGKFDRSTGHYVDNLIVYADVVPPPFGRGIILGFEAPEYFPTTTTTTLVSDTTIAETTVPTSTTPAPPTSVGTSGPPTSVGTSGQPTSVGTPGPLPLAPSNPTGSTGAPTAPSSVVTVEAASTTTVPPAEGPATAAAGEAPTSAPT